MLGKRLLNFLLIYGVPYATLSEEIVAIILYSFNYRLHNNEDHPRLHTIKSKRETIRKQSLVQLGPHEGWICELLILVNEGPCSTEKALIWNWKAVGTVIVPGSRGSEFHAPNPLNQRSTSVCCSAVLEKEVALLTSWMHGPLMSSSAAIIPYPR